MRKNIDIDESLLLKLKLISVFEEMSVKGVMETTVGLYMDYKEKELLTALSEEEKEEVENSKGVEQLTNIKKLKGDPTAYR